jgi:predicted O-methyltransferase YrrM
VTLEATIASPGEAPHRFAAELSRDMRTAAGEPVDLHSNISDEAGGWLRDAIRIVRPSAMLEVGMAFGVASLYMLDATREANLVSIDPWQSTQWGGAGITNVERAGYAGRHELVEEPDHVALPSMAARGERFQFAYVDGSHNLDHVFLDCFYINRMLDTGGVIAFNDTRLATVRFAIWFMLTHRHYVERRYGWSPQYAGRNTARRLVRRVLRWPSQDRYFEKVDDWQPDWEDCRSLRRYAKIVLGRERAQA